jgi:hypothetical protein
MGPPRDDKRLAVYCWSAALWHARGHAEDPQQQRSEAEVVAPGVVARWFFRGDLAAARALLRTPRYGPPLRSRSRFNRRRHRLTELFVRLREAV